MDPQNSTVPTIPPPQPLAPPVSPVFPKKNNLVVILLSIFLVITLLISGYLFLQVQKLNKELAGLQIQVQPTPTPFPETPPADPTANWQTYSNQEIGFSIKYPQGWREQKWTGEIGFGPKEIGEDVLFGINYYSKSTTSINAIASKIGGQFADRKETIAANKIIVLT